MENREFFRVQDLMPVVVRKIEKGEESEIRSRVIPGSGLPQVQANTVDEESDVDPKLWNMLVEINTRLGLILEKLNMDSDGLCKEQSQQVNISEGGARFAVKEKYGIGDILEIKLSLSSFPFTGLVVYGRVSRISEIGDQEYEVGVTFLDLEDDVREILFRYVLQRQRGMIRRQLDRAT